MKSITVRTALLVSLAMLVMAVAMFIYFISSIYQITGESLTREESLLRQEYDNLIKQQTGALISSLNFFAKQVETGQLTLEEGKKQAADLARVTRYNDDESGYFWVDTYEGILVSHPYLQQNEGKSRYDLVATDFDGTERYLVREIIAAGMNNEGGFTDYPWVKPGTADPEKLYPKRGYSLKFAPFEWVVGTGNYVDNIDDIIMQRNEHESEHIFTVSVQLIFVSFIAYIATLLPTIFVAARVSRPMRLLSGALKTIAAGDLSERHDIKSSTAEINEIAYQLSDGIIKNFHDILGTNNIFVRQARTSVNAITANSIVVNDSVEKINDNIDEAKEKSIELSAKAAEVVKISGEIDQIVAGQGDSIGNQKKMINQTLYETKAISREVDTIADMTQKALDNTVGLTAVTKNGSEKTDSTNKLIQTLSSQIAGMRKQVEVINSITEQTNLLAMNAAIEASHAGEAGKGFSVVANEIRMLAQNTSENATQINNTLQLTFDTINSAQKSSDDCVAVFNEIENSIEKFGNSFSRINESGDKLLSSSHSVDNLTGEINLATEHVIANSDKINRTLKEVNQLLAMVSKSADNNNNIIMQVARQSGNIKTQQNENIAIMQLINNIFTVLDKNTNTFKLGNMSENILIHATFADAILSHQDWRNTIRNAMITNQTELGADVAFNSDGCVLGAWIRENAPKIVGKEHKFRELVTKHRRFHYLAGTIIKALERGDREVAVANYLKIREISYDLVKILTFLQSVFFKKYFNI